MSADQVGPTLELEQSLFAGGFRLIAGIDEAGRGALAGPVVAAAVILPVDQNALVESMVDVRDSKQLSPERREQAYRRIEAGAQSWAVGSATNREVDQLGLLPATRLSMMRALAGLEIHPDHLLLDYMVLSEDERPQTSLARADAKSLSVAAASIMAKVSRDHLMLEYDRDYPEYGFGRHKGYGTVEHRAALRRLGPTPLHRRSYAPVSASIAYHEAD